MIDSSLAGFAESPYFDKNNYDNKKQPVNKEAHDNSFINYLIGQVPLRALEAILNNQDAGAYTDADREELKFINQEEDQSRLIDDKKNEEFFDSLENFPDLQKMLIGYIENLDRPGETVWGGITNRERAQLESILLPMKQAQVQAVKQWYRDIRDSHDPADKLITKAIRKEALYNDTQVFPMLNNRGSVWQKNLNDLVNSDTLKDSGRRKEFEEWYRGLSDEDKTALGVAMKKEGNFLSKKYGYFVSIPYLQRVLEGARRDQQQQQQQQQQQAGGGTPTPTMSPPPKRSPTPTITPPPTNSPIPSISPTPPPNSPTPTPPPSGGGAGGSGGQQQEQQQQEQPQRPFGPFSPGGMPTGERGGPQRGSSYRRGNEQERRRNLEQEKWGDQPDDEQWFNADPGSNQGEGEEQEERRRKNRKGDDGEDRNLFSSTGDPFSGLDFGQLPDDFGQYGDFRSYGQHRNTADGTEIQYSRLYQNNMNTFKKAMNDFTQGSGPANETMDQYQERIGAGIHPNREFGYTSDFSALGRSDYDPLKQMSDSNTPFRSNRGRVKRKMKGRFTNRQANDILGQFYNNQYDSPAGLEDLIAAYAENKLGEEE
jgi:hypothetical protein